MIDPEDFARLTDVEWRSHIEVERGIFVAEGLPTIERALRAGYVIRSVLTSPRWLDGLLSIGIEDRLCIVRPEPELELLTGFHVHRGALAAFERPPAEDVGAVLRTARRLVVVEDVVDHANVGAIMRSVAAFGFDAVVLTPRCADPLYRRAIKVSMGNVFNTRWARIDWPIGLHRLHESGFATIALTPHPDALDIRSIPADVRSGRLAVLLGTEGEGLHPKTIRDATLPVRIPMADVVDSLNVAVAAAVACFELTR